MELRFWGVRGSIATPSSENLGFGGNTTCIEVRGPAGEIIVIDAGTGIRKLGNALMAEFPGRQLTLHILLTHFHWDHIQGMPFFVPLYLKTNQVTFWSAISPERLRETLEGQMAHPYFPVPFSMLEAQRGVCQLDGGTQIGTISIKTCPLNHPQGAFGFRFTSEGRSIVHASDFEHGDPDLDRHLREFARDADVLIYDSQYTPEEYERHRGWGHSTWLEATRVARDAGVRRLVLFHHHPDHDDSTLDGIVDLSRREFPNTEAAREGHTIRV